MKCVFAFVLAALCNSVVQAQIGPPEPRAYVDGFSLGFGVNNRTDYWSYGNQVDNIQFIVESSRGLTEDLEVFGRLGVSNPVINNGITYSSNSSDLSPNTFTPSFSIGVRGCAWESRNYNWRLGGSIAWSHHSEFIEYVNWQPGVYQEIVIDSINEIDAGLSISWEPLGWDLKLYGGPFLHWGYVKGNTMLYTPSDSALDIINIRDKGGVGGFLGFTLPIENNWYMQSEARIGDGVSGGVFIFKRW